VVIDFSVDHLTKDPNQIELLSQICTESLNESKPIVLFGSGTVGKLYLEYFRRINPLVKLYFCDNNPSTWGTFIEDVLIISLNELKTKYSGSYIIISSLEYYDEISLQLKENRLTYITDPGTHYALMDPGNIFDTFKNYVSLIKENISDFQLAYSYLSDELSKRTFYDRINHCITASSKYLTPLKSDFPQYFDPDIIKLSDEEIFIDGGAYIGDTVEEFLKQTSKKFKKVYSFEPEESKHGKFKRVSDGDNRIQLMPYGLWSKREVLRFHSQGTYASGLDESGNTEIPVISIDEVLDGEPVTFIKLDVEGAELEALKGAERSIKKYRPKLAVCVYHKPLDLAEILVYLKELVPEYKIYLRHYGVGMYETVCYAVAE
jgi:FkbM family methyltransferase